MAEIINIGIKLIRIYLKDASKLEISDNAGISWDVINSGYIGEFYYLGKRDYIIFAETSLGQFQSVTEGRTWSEKIWKRNKY